MVFALTDIWYVTFAKGMILTLALAIMISIVIQSLWNCSARSSAFSASVGQRAYWSVAKNGFAVSINLLFIWFMVQGLVLLLFGYFGVSPIELVRWRFQEITMAGVPVMVWQYARYKDRSTKPG